MPAPAGLDTTWLMKFIRDQIQQTPLAPQAASKSTTHEVDTLTVNSGIKLDGVAQPKITTSALAQGPPPAPSNGDIWIATAVNSSGTRWQFQYDVSDAVHPWKFIGGAPVHAFYNSTLQNVNDNVWEVITGTPSFTLVRAGQYEYDFGGVFTGNNNVIQYLGVGSTGGILAPYTYSRVGNSFAANQQWPMAGSAADFDNGVSRTAGTVISVWMQSSSHPNTSISFPWLTVTPVAIS